MTFDTYPRRGQEVNRGFSTLKIVRINLRMMVSLKALKNRKEEGKWRNYIFGDFSGQPPPQEAAAPPDHRRTTTGAPPQMGRFPCPAAHMCMADHMPTHPSIKPLCLPLPISFVLLSFPLIFCHVNSTWWACVCVTRPVHYPNSVPKIVYKKGGRSHTSERQTHTKPQAKHQK